MDTKDKVALAAGVGLLGFLILRSRSSSTPAQQGAQGGGNWLEARSQSPLPDYSQAAIPPEAEQPAQVSPQTIRVLQEEFQDEVRGNPAIWTVQQKLRRLGFDPGILDGRWGPDTLRAVQDFARAYGVTPPTRLTTAIVALIERAYAERYGSSAPSVSGSSGGAVAPPTTKAGAYAEQPSSYDLTKAQGQLSGSKVLSDWLPEAAIAGAGRYARRY